jgi:hypothetical protein
MPTTIRKIHCILLCCNLASCALVGPHALRADQVEYARALGEAKKREILALMVGLRYADLPGFLNVSNIIAAYTFDATGSVVLRGDPSSTGTLSYSDHPTFTFTPTTGESFARAYIHPLAPALILPLADSGVPIDLLLRISMQSMGPLRNATMLGGSDGAGSPGFFELLHVLRRLQLAGELAIRYRSSEAVSLIIGASAHITSAQINADIDRARMLLNVVPGVREFEITYGTTSDKPNHIPVVTRSVLAILTDLGAEIATPQADVDSGTTKPSVPLVGGETRPVILVHATADAPKNAYTSIAYHSTRFWIDDADFDSKYAITVVQDLMALAEITDNTHAPIVTIPAN